MTKQKAVKISEWRPAPFVDDAKDIVVGGVKVHVHGRYQPVISTFDVSADGARLVFGFATDPHGSRLGDSWARVLDLRTRTELAGLRQGAPIRVELATTRPWVAASSFTGAIHIHDLETGIQLVELAPESAADHHRFAFDRTGHAFAHGGYRAVTILDLATWKSRHRIELAENPRAVAFTQELVVATTRELRFCDPETAQVRHTMTSSMIVDELVTSALHANRLVVLGDRQAQIYDAHSRQPIATLPGEVRGVTLGPHDQAAVLRARSIELWNFASMQFRELIAGPHAIGGTARFAGSLLVKSGTHLRFIELPT